MPFQRKTGALGLAVVVFAAFLAYMLGMNAAEISIGIPWYALIIPGLALLSVVLVLSRDGVKEFGFLLLAGCLFGVLYALIATPGIYKF